jgi:hypothetical protein
MPSVLSDLIAYLGLFLSAIGFLVVGLALGRLVFDHFRMGTWQMQIAYVLGLFGLLIGIAAFTSPGSAGAFALGVGLAYFMNMMPPKPAPPA